VHEDHQEEHASFPVAPRSEDSSRHTDLEDLCDEHIDTTSLLLFQSSLDLFKDVRSLDSFKDVRGSLEPKSEQVEVYYRPIKAETINETPKETPKSGAQRNKKKSVLKSCLSFRVEQGTCSTDGDFTAELSLTSGRGRKSVDISERTVNTFRCYPDNDVQADDKSDEDVQADDRRGVGFSEVTVRTFVCRLGDNPSTSKYIDFVVKAY
jgi:hypothetical protein